MGAAAHVQLDAGRKYRYFYSSLWKSLAFGTPENLARKLATIMYFFPPSTFLTFFLQNIWLVLAALKVED